MSDDPIDLSKYATFEPIPSEPAEVELGELAELALRLNTRRRVGPQTVTEPEGTYQQVSLHWAEQTGPKSAHLRWAVPVGCTPDDLELFTNYQVDRAFMYLEAEAHKRITAEFWAERGQ